MPQLLRVGPYIIYIWSNENNTLARSAIIADWNYLAFREC